MLVLTKMKQEGTNALPTFALVSSINTDAGGKSSLGAEVSLQQVLEFNKQRNSELNCQQGDQWRDEGA